MTTEPLALADAAEGSDEDDIMGATHQLGVDPASIAYNNLRSMMKVVNDEVTVEWGKNGLIRQKIENTVKSLRCWRPRRHSLPRPGRLRPTRLSRTREWSSRANGTAARFLLLVEQALRKGGTGGTQGLGRRAHGGRRRATLHGAVCSLHCTSRSAAALSPASTNGTGGAQEMVDVDDLKAACAVYEKRVAVEAMKARRSDHEVNVLNYKLELAKQEIEELRKLKLVIAGLEVSNEELAEKLEVPALHRPLAPPATCPLRQRPLSNTPSARRRARPAAVSPCSSLNGGG